MIVAVVFSQGFCIFLFHSRQILFQIFADVWRESVMIFNKEGSRDALLEKPEEQEVENVNEGM